MADQSMIDVGNGMQVNASLINDQGRAMAANVKNPPASPTAVVSSGVAANDVSNINSEVANASTAIDAQSAKKAADAKAAANALTAKNAGKTPPLPPTPEEQIINTPEPGHYFAYDKATGQRSEVAIGSQLPGTMTTSDPNKPNDVGAIETGTTTYKQLSDGSWGAYDSNGKYVGMANSTVVAAAQGMQRAVKDLEAIKNGSYPLNPLQQAQLDNVHNEYNKLMAAQETENANVTGNETGLQNLFGVGGSPIAVSAINKTIADGAQKIAQLNNEMIAKISSLQASIKADNINAVKSLYEDYKDLVDAKQKEIDTIHAETVAAGNKMTQNQATQNDFFAKKYSDTTSPILPSDTNAEMIAKLQTSPRWQNDQIVAKGLDADATKFWADMAVSGVSLAAILPNLGIGAVAAQAKLAIMQGIYKNAQTLGLTAQEVANGILDKKAKAATYVKLQAQGSQLAAQESKVVSDFELVKQAGAKLDDNTLQTGVTFLQNWINTGTLQTSGNAALNNYLGLLTTSLTNYARVVAGQTGSAGTTANMNTEIQGIINKGLTVKAVNSYIDEAAIPEMKNTVKGYDDTLKSLMGNMNVADGTLNATATEGGLGTGGVQGETGGTTNGNNYTSPSGKTYTLPY